MYTVGSFPRTVWERYLQIFDTITVFARNGGPIDADKDLARSDHPKVSFELIDTFPNMERLTFGDGQASKKLKRLLENADAMIARLPSDLGNLATRLAHKMDVPFAVEAVGCPIDGYGNHGSLAAKLYAPLAARRMRRSVALASHVIYVTERFLQERYPSQNYQIGVSDVEIVTMNDAETKRRQARLRALRDGTPAKIGTVASLSVKSKGIQTAIASLAKLRDMGRDYHYHVLGAGDRAPWVTYAQEAGVADLVHFNGARSSGEGVRNWLDDIDIHLQPSFQEGLPRATVEAMSRGCACLASTAGGLPELVPQDRLHRPGDVTALANLLDRFASDPDWIYKAYLHDKNTMQRYLPEVLDERRQSFYADLAKAVCVS